MINQAKDVPELMERVRNCIQFLQGNPGEKDLIFPGLQEDFPALTNALEAANPGLFGTLLLKMNAMLRHLEKTETVEASTGLLLKAIDAVQAAKTGTKAPNKKQLQALSDIGIDMDAFINEGWQNGTAPQPGESAPAKVVEDIKATANQSDPDPALVSSLKEEFIEQLMEMETDLTALESEPDNLELLNRIFRTFHSLKGAAQSIGLTAIGGLAHRTEEVLDHLRKKKIHLNKSIMDAVLEAGDNLREMTESLPEIADPDLSEIIGRLKSALDGDDNETGRQSTLSSGDFRPSSKPADTSHAQSVRVKVEKLNDAINLMGELVIVKNRLDHGILNLRQLLNGQPAPRRLKDVEDCVIKTSESMEYVGKVMTELQDSIMKLRMVPVGVVFNRFPRLIRDLSFKTNKEVTLQILGEETEIDKTIVEELTDPLMHLLRNSIDHGIEDPETRKQLNKAKRGLIKLTAAHEGNQIAIYVEDDGKGLNPELLKKKALEKGLKTIQEIEEMQDEDTYQLIFEPGFSTKEQATDLSGRGVGMDVVKTNISRLNGLIRIESRPDEGTVFSIKLPLTLAIIEALIVEGAGQMFAVPLSNVREILNVSPEDVRLIASKPVISLRGQITSIVRLEDILHLENPVPPPADQREQNIKIVIVGSVEKQIGIIVKRCISKSEIVIKPIGDLLTKVKFISGGTITGSGKVVLILDVASIISSEDILQASDTSRISAMLSGRPETGPKDKNRMIRGKVLVVEDSGSTRKMITRLFETAGYMVEGADSGEDGLEKALAGSYDLITSDIMMPGMDGYQFIKKLRGMEEYRDQPVFIISTRNRREEIDRCLGAGANEYLEKQNIKSHLIDLVSKYL